VGGFDLVLSAPPYYHPSRKSVSHGIGYTGNLEGYVSTVATVLARCSSSVMGRRVCFVKTDVWYKGALIPVGFELMRACVRQGLRLRAHWIWERFSRFSPYAPSFSNVFIFGETFSRPHFSGVISGTPEIRKNGLSRSYSPGIFRVLMERLTERGNVILDPFAGAGGIIEAADACDRWSVGVELSSRQIRLAASHLHRIPEFVSFATEFRSSGDEVLLDE
jgi:DNA modification methylase